MDMCGSQEACKKCKGRYCASKTSLFGILEEPELKEITDKINHRTYKKGEIIFLEGEESDKLYVINHGKVKVFRYTKEGKEQILYIVSTGEFLGDLSLLKKSEFRFNAEALEDVNICELTKDDFDNVVERNPEISLKILEVLYEKIRKLENLVQSLSTKDIETRISGLLLGLIKDFGEPEGNIVRLELPLSREDMANYIGVTRETISRRLNSMQDEGILTLLGNKTIILNDIEYLEELN